VPVTELRSARDKSVAIYKAAVAAAAAAASGAVALSQLRLAAAELSGDILTFLNRRGRGAPPRPAPATRDRDVDAILQFEDTTTAEYEAWFGARVRRTHDLLALQGLRDPDLDAFSRRPANAFQIDVVARKLAALAQRLVPRTHELRDHSFFPPRAF